MFKFSLKFFIINIPDNLSGFEIAVIKGKTKAKEIISENALINISINKPKICSFLNLLMYLETLYNNWTTPILIICSLF